VPCLNFEISDALLERCELAEDLGVSLLVSLRRAEQRCSKLLPVQLRRRTVGHDVVELLRGRLERCERIDDRLRHVVRGVDCRL